MAFTFLHTADLHLGSPFQGLALKDDVVARRFAEASRAAFSDLVSLAIAEKVAFVVIAGDVYDGTWKDVSVGLFFNREISRLSREGIPAFLIRGNHDAESVVAQSVPPPEGVRQFSSRHAETLKLESLKVALHGRSFPDRAVPENLALAYPPPLPGWFNIGLLHTSLEGNANHATYAPCSISDLQGRGYDYWALGHVHDHAVLSQQPYIVYPGNLQGRSIRERGPKGAVLVDVADGRVTGLRPRAVDRARWSLVEIDATGLEDDSALRSRLAVALRDELAPQADKLVALRVVISGETPLHRALVADAAAWHTDIQGLAHHAHGDVWLEAAKIRTRNPAAGTPAGAGLEGLDVAALLAGLSTDPEMRALAADQIHLLKDRMPQGLELPEDVDALLAEATDLALARLIRSGEG